MEFKIKHCFRHWKTTIIGVLVLLLCFALVFLKLAEFADVSPLLLLVVPFLLYGKKKTPPTGGNDPE